jgi:hypothetical protein
MWCGLERARFRPLPPLTCARDRGRALGVRRPPETGAKTAATPHIYTQTSHSTPSTSHAPPRRGGEPAPQRRGRCRGRRARRHAAPHQAPLPGQDLAHAPGLALRQRAAGVNADGVSDRARILLVVGLGGGVGETDEGEVRRFGRAPRTTCLMAADDTAPDDQEGRSPGERCPLPESRGRASERVARGGHSTTKPPPPPGLLEAPFWLPPFSPASFVASLLPFFSP